MPIFNKKRREIKKTREIFGEGCEDKAFLKHLKSLYSRESEFYVKISCGSGGSPLDVVESAIRKSKADEIFVIVDRDKPEKESVDARYKANLSNIDLIEVESCMESMLIEIIEGKRKHNGSKAHFESKYIDARKRRDTEAYAKKFPKILLEKQRHNIEELDKIIKIIEGL